MKQKNNKLEKSLVSINSLNVLEPTSIAVVIKNEDHFKQLRDRSIGKPSLPATYGAGPLGYTGIQNKTETVFAGINKADNKRYIIIYKGSAGLNEFESAIQDKQLNAIWTNASFSKVEAEVVIPISKDLKSRLMVNSNNRTKQHI